MHSLLQCREQDLSGIYRVINARHGQILDVYQLSCALTFTVKAYLLVRESFGFIADIGSSTKGQAFVQCVVDHWRMLNDDPFDTTSQSGEIEVCTMYVAKCLAVAMSIQCYQA